MVTHLRIPVKPLSSGLLINGAKTLSGVVSVYNQVRDTATEWAIHRADPANDNGHLVFGVFFRFNP